MVTVKLISNAVCQKELDPSKHFIVHDSHMCATHERGEGTCGVSQMAKNPHIFLEDLIYFYSCEIVYCSELHHT